MNTRMEHDTMGAVAVPADRHWGAQTQRSLENFRIGGQRQPREIITAFAYLKEACAKANAACGKLTQEQADAVAAVCGEDPGGEVGRGISPGGLADRQRYPDQYECQRGHRPPDGGAGRAPASQ
ncbi:MAG: lyase family protein [Dysosmobacter sp.]